ncbi:MAG: hypothetical protein ACXAB2_12865 [Candidatus Hodarchaeales archaeon]|jgi:hypothetical protein
MVEINKTTSAMIIIAIFITYPFISASLFGFLFTRNSTNFSIYNEGWNGASEFKDRFVNHANQGQIATIIGSSNVLNRLNSSEMNDTRGSLIILGPAIHYDFSESLAILMYAINGGRVLIADDFGTGNDILSVLSIFLGFLSEIDLGSMMQEAEGSNPIGMNTSAANASVPFPIAGIRFGTKENGSLIVDMKNNDQNPLTPIFTPPTNTETSYAAPWNEPFTTGLTNLGVVGNFASIITMKVREPIGEDPDTNKTLFGIKEVPMGEFPGTISAAWEQYDLGNISFSFKIAALYSSDEAWLERDLSGAKQGVDHIEPDPHKEWGNPTYGFPIFASFPIPLNEGQIILCSDPSIFINQYVDTDNEKYNASYYDNSVFMDNIVDVLMEDRPGQTIIFDEGHLANNPFSPIFPLSLYLKFLDMITMFPLFAIFLVPIAIIISRKFIPKRTQAKPLLLTRVERYYGRSFFAVKMRWFLEYKQYSRGLELIYRRLKRNLIRRYNPEEDLTPEVIAAYLVNEFPDQFSIQNLVTNLNLIEGIIDSRALLTEEGFLDHYFFLKNIGTAIS